MRLRSVLPCLLLGAAAACRPDPPAPPSPGSLPPPVVPGDGLETLSEPPRRPTAPWCSAPLRLTAALPDPEHRSDREGEWVELRNDGPVPVPLDGWRLVSGEREAPLDGTVLAGGRTLRAGGLHGRLELGSIRLANDGDRIRLVDPCGLVRASLAWGRGAIPAPAPAERLVAPVPWTQPRRGPARVAPCHTPQSIGDGRAQRPEARPAHAGASGARADG